MVRNRAVAHRGVLCIGFLALAGGVAAAIGTPPEGYEVSIYRSTPLAYWAGLAVAVAAAFAALSIGSARGERPLAGLALGGTALLSVVGLPLLRGYRFYGFNDSLTHLGWTRAIGSGELAPTELLYPGSHALSAGVASVTGLSATHAMQLVVVAFAALSLLFVPLLVRLVYPDWRATVIAAGSALLFLPVNLNGFKLLYFPYSFAAFLTPAALYLFFRHMVGGTDDGGAPPLFGWLTAPGAAFVLAAVAIVVIHPQVALNLVIFCAVVTALQAARTRGDPARAADERPVLGLTVALTLAFALWVVNYPPFYAMLDQAVTSLSGVLTGEAGTGQAIADRQSSIAQVGGIGALFLKLFGIETAYVLLSGLGLYGLRTDWFEHLAADRRAVLASLLYGGVALGPFFLLHLFGRLSAANYFFRHVGFGLLLCTVVGSIVLRQLFDRPTPQPRGAARPVAVAIATLLVLASVATLFPSPLVHLPSNHVSDRQLHGYRTAFEHADGDVPFDGVRAAPDRYAEAMPGAPRPAIGERVPPSSLDDLTAATDGPRYLPITEVTVEREVVAYEELRYSESQLAAVADQPGVDRAVAGGGVAVYHVAGGVNRTGG